MRRLIGGFLPNRELTGRAAWAGGLIGIAALAFLWGRFGAAPQVIAQSPVQSRDTGPNANGQRAVAKIYQDIYLSRQELGEYLIARFGQERLEFFINQKIIQKACHDRNIVVTDAEVQAQLEMDLKTMSMGSPTAITEKDFAEKILKRYNKTIYEWREDVIRPKVQLKRMVQTSGSATPTEKELYQVYEAKYGEMRECRMIIWPKEMLNRKEFFWAKVKDKAEEFDKAARTQHIAALASKDGLVPPIHKWFENSEIERAAFSLSPDEVSGIIELPNSEGFMILKCVKRIPARTEVKFQDKKLELYTELLEQKTQKAIQEFFHTLRTQAAPEKYLETRPSYTEPDQRSRREFGMQAH